MRIEIDLRPNAGGVDFLDHTRYRVKIDKVVKSLSADPLEVMELIEEEMRAKAYSR